MTGAVDRADLYVVLGATGGIGRAVVAEATARGHRVRAVSRSASSARDLPAGVERLDVDVSSPGARPRRWPEPASSCTRPSRTTPAGRPSSRP